MKRRRRSRIAFLVVAFSVAALSACGHGQLEDLPGSEASEALVPPAPAANALIKRYYVSADNGEDAYYPWQFTNGFDKIKDSQRAVNGVASTWIVTNCSSFCGWDIFAFG
jgi:hypothetical protein